MHACMHAHRSHPFCSAAALHGTALSSGPASLARHRDLSLDRGLAGQGRHAGVVVGVGVGDVEGVGGEEAVGLQGEGSEKGEIGGRAGK